MIEILFTIDYEIYGNGSGSLTDQIFVPTERLMAIFKKWSAPLVIFVEAIELARIQEYQSDKAILDIRHQLRELYLQNNEIGLHVHPQWSNARYENGEWVLDYSEYNMCTLQKERITKIISHSLAYLRDVLGEPEFTPLAFRAGNWLFQPTDPLAAVLTEAGIKIDSSVFKGGLQHGQKLDYRPSLKNGYYWRFKDDVNCRHPSGELIEFPTHTTMVPFWKMLTGKRIGLHKAAVTKHPKHHVKVRLMDYFRFWYPLKFDFCRMNSNELLSMLSRAIKEDAESKTVYKPLVLIGHTKDLYDFEAIDALLSVLHKSNVKVTTFNQAYDKCRMYA